jgi:hypothetical protein
MVRGDDREQPDDLFGGQIFNPLVRALRQTQFSGIECWDFQHRSAEFQEQLEHDQYAVLAGNAQLAVGHTPPEIQNVERRDRFQGSLPQHGHDPRTEAIPDLDLSFWGVHAINPSIGIECFGCFAHLHSPGTVLQMPGPAKRENLDWGAAALPSRFSRLFRFSQLRHPGLMLLLFLQFVLELIRALLIDELSCHVRNQVGRVIERRRQKPHGISWQARIHRRYRPIHRLRTAPRDNS